MLLAELNRGKRSSEKRIEWALWLYGSMAPRRHLKNIFIVPKQRLIQIIQRKRKHIVQINFVGKNYLYATASGNSLWNGYRAIAGGGNLALLCSTEAFSDGYHEQFSSELMLKVGGIITN